LVCEKLDDAFRRIERVSEAAAHLIKNHIKVIIPLNSAEGGTGSTSQSHYPGRVLLRHVEITGPATLATSLVHEAMHQVMYILEWGGTFIIDDPDARDVRVTSGWTGRDLPLHSYIHACYVWYGLSTFWGLARSSEIFTPGAVEGQLARSLAGFKDENPAERLAPYAGMVRYDVLKVAGTLRDHLEGVM
jgi:HEXXH motif-containing protein